MREAPIRPRPQESPPSGPSRPTVLRLSPSVPVTECAALRAIRRTSEIGYAAAPCGPKAGIFYPNGGRITYARYVNT
jgi:hypothetical protein